MTSAAAAVALLLLVAASTPAATPVDQQLVSPDITISLGNAVVSPNDVAIDANPVTLLDLGPLPANVHVTGFDPGPGGQRRLTFDQTVSLSNVTAEPRDVVSFNGATYAIIFDGSVQGVPAGARIDALASVGDELILSFDVAVSLPNGPSVDDEDLVQVSDSGFTVLFDGSAAGVPASLDLDAAHRLSNGHLLLSFDGSGQLGNVTFDDDDVLEHDPLSGSWEKVYDGGTRSSAWVGADLEAFAAEEIPTPTPTSTETPTLTSTATPTHTETVAPTFTASPTHTATPTVVLVDTSTPTRVPSDTPTASPTATETRVPTSTPTPSPSPSLSPTPTTTPTSPGVETETPTPIVTSSVTPTSIGTATSTPTEMAPEETSTPTATATPTSSSTPTATLPAGTYFAGDANCDGLVNAADSTAIASLIGLGMEQCGSDADCNGVTDAADIDATIAIIYSGMPLAPCSS